MLTFAGEYTHCTPMILLVNPITKQNHLDQNAHWAADGFERIGLTLLMHISKEWIKLFY